MHSSNPAASASKTPFDFDEPVDRRSTGSLKWDKYEGRDVLPFWVADMDFRSPPEVIEAIRKRVDHGAFGYGKIRDSLYQAVLDYLDRDHGVSIDRESIVWLPGLVPALNMACRACGAPGESVLTCSPVYPPFLSAPRNADKQLIDVPLLHDPVDGRWAFDFPAMATAVRNADTRARILLLCNPHNPTGRVYGEAELTRLHDFCLAHDLVLCSDEIHCDLILDPDRHPHRSATALTGPLRDQAITLMSPRKTYNIAGLGFSFAIIPNPGLRAHFRRAGEGFLSEINVTAPFAAEAAYRHGEPWRRELLAYLRGNRDTLYEFVGNNLPGVRMSPMHATYLAWMDVRQLELGDDPAGFFESAGVSLSDGRYFGLPGFVRFNFGCTRELMLEGLRRMKNALEARP